MLLIIFKMSLFRFVQYLRLSTLSWLEITKVFVKCILLMARPSPKI